VQLPEALKASFEMAAVEQQKKDAMRARMIRELGESMTAAPDSSAPGKAFEFKARGDMGGLNLPTLEELLPEPTPSKKE